MVSTFYFVIFILSYQKKIVSLQKRKYVSKSKKDW